MIEQKDRMKGAAAMSVFLGQLPPAELARLKAELAETLIANFCYPRFFDHRTNSLRMRPADRSKRQEVWLYLSSIDFTAWNRVDLMSPDFQRQIERLIVYFVQRNRNFFGQQGRKRMPDVRMLITSCAAQVVDGLRGHLMGRQPSNPPFGSPRPAVSWSTANVSGRPEPSWEQIVSATMLLQQQIQEVRGEIKAAPVSEVPAAPVPAAAPAPTPVRPQARRRKVEHGLAHVEQEVPPPGPITNGKSAPHVKGDPAPPLAASISIAPPPPSTISTSAPRPTIAAPDPIVPFVEAPTSPTPVIDRLIAATQTRPPVPEQVQPPASPVPTFPAATQSRVLPHPSQPLPSPQAPPVPHMPSSTEVAASQTRNAAPAVHEDVAIFEQLRYQLILWLRIEVIRLGIDITGQTPLQLLEVLRQQNGFDEIRLQIVSTLLNLSNQVINNGQASLFDYKQGMMFYLVHTQR